MAAAAQLIPGRTVVAAFGKVYLSEPPNGRPPGHYVYQRTRLGWGHWPYSASRALQLRRWVMPYDPQTLPQRHRRNLFREAVAAWQLLPLETRKRKFKYSPHRNLPNYQDFISNYLRLGHAP